MDHFFEAFRKYATFSGRSGLAEFWYFFLLHCAIVLALGTLATICFMVGLSSVPLLYIPSMVFLMLLLLYSLGSFIPAIAVLVRRLHDAGHAGTWFFINFIPIIGPLVLLVFLAQAGEPTSNAYGESPTGAQ